jgi:hypothetical protein
MLPAWSHRDVELGGDFRTTQVMADRYTTDVKEYDMSLGTILLIVLILALVGVIPAWPHSRGWGYGPTGIVGVIVVVLLVLVLMGRL